MFGKKYKIGDAIAKLRKEKGWTQIELAEKLQVSDKAVSKWESNKGDPSLEFLPALAELFGVTLDFLMTGKEQKEKIVTMSKLELAAKKDDVNMFKELGVSDSFKDENGKDFFDYIFQYESIELFKNIGNKEHYAAAHKNNIEALEKLYYMRIKTNDLTVIRDLIRLDYKGSKINHHLNTYEDVIGYNGSRLTTIKRRILSDRIFDLILYDKHTDASVKDAMLINHTERENKYYSPAISYGYLIDYVLRKEDYKLAKELLEKAITFNESNSNVLKQFSPGYFNEFSIYVGYVNIPKETFDLLLDREKYDLIELANKCNIIYKDKFSNNSLYKDIFVLSKYDIETNKIKHDKKMSTKEKSIKMCIHEGILNIDEILATNDYELIKNNLYKYPVNYIEIFSNMIKDKDYKNLFKTAVDMGLSTDNILKEQMDKFSREIISEFWTNAKSTTETWNRRPVDDFKKFQEPNVKYFKDWKEKRSYGMYNATTNEALTIEDLLQKFKESRDVIMQDLTFEKEKITKDLSKEFFQTELAKNNIDRVVINLCVKLEAILKYDYRYDGDFQEMLSKYCETFNTYDDEDNNYDTKTPRLLNKLRMYRNGMVHATATEESLTKDEIKYCIDYICSLDKKGR